MIKVRSFDLNFRILEKVNRGFYKKRFINYERN
jgi:hypothetical protein